MCYSAKGLWPVSKINTHDMIISGTYSFYFSGDMCDIALDPNSTNQYIVWAIGGLGETAFVHFSRAECKEGDSYRL